MLKAIAANDEITAENLISAPAFDASYIQWLSNDNRHQQAVNYITFLKIELKSLWTILYLERLQSTHFVNKHTQLVNFTSLNHNSFTTKIMLKYMPYYVNPIFIYDTV